MRQEEQLQIFLFVFENSFILWLKTLVSICFGSPRFGQTTKTNSVKLQSADRDTLNFDFLKMGLELLSAPHIQKYFPRYLILTDQISLSYYRYFLRILPNIYCNFFFSSYCDAITFEIYLRFLSSSFCTMTIYFVHDEAILLQNQNSEQTVKYFKNEKSFQGEIKSIFHWKSQLFVFWE